MSRFSMHPAVLSGLLALFLGTISACSPSAPSRPASTAPGSMLTPSVMPTTSPQTGTSATLHLVQQTLSELGMTTAVSSGTSDAAARIPSSDPVARIGIAAAETSASRFVLASVAGADAVTTAPGLHHDPDLADIAAETRFSLNLKSPREGAKLRLAAFERGLAADDEIARALTAKKLEAGSARYDSLADFLAAELGKRFHRRAEWTGGRAAYAPNTDGSRKWEPIGAVKYVTIHHAEGVPDEHPARMIRNIFVGHTDIYGRLRGADVGYHFFVDPDGEVWEGRNARRLGTHVGSRPAGLNNEGNLGVCGLGTFGSSYPPRKMADTLAALPVLIARYYGRSLTVRGHREWVGIHGYRPIGGTDCPGKLMASVQRAREAMRQAFKDDKPRDVAGSDAKKTSKSSKSETASKPAAGGDSGRSAPSGKRGGITRPSRSP